MRLRDKNFLNSDATIYILKNDDDYMNKGCLKQNKDDAKKKRKKLKTRTM